MVKKKVVIDPPAHAEEELPKAVDPFLEREIQKYGAVYGFSVPSREFIMALLEKRGLATRQELLEEFNLETPDEQEALRRRLKAMERDGQLIRTRKGGYGLVDKMELVPGRILAHKDGFGFVVPEDGSSDLFIPERQMRRVFHGDKVLARATGNDVRGRREGVIIDVLEHNTQQLTGRFFVEEGISYVIPDNPRFQHQVLIPPEANIPSATTGQMVVVDVVTQPGMHNLPIGHIREVLGDHMAPGLEIDVAIRSHELPHVWPEKVLEEIQGLTERVQSHDKEGRLDLRDLPLVTIDGEDAEDFDDAVYCEKLPKNGWHLYVAIADVSFYVKPNTALDEEAANRGNSVYFPGRTIPMLPHVLSDGLCSLKPRVDRLCMVCKISVSSTGKVRSYSFHEAVMRSQARLTYEKVFKLISGTDSYLTDRYPGLLPHLFELHKLYQALHKERQARGAIDFEIPETQIVFGKDKKIARIVPRLRNDAHRIIEECMLLANVCAAEFLLSHKMHTLFRTHGGPEPDKLVDLRKFLTYMGLKLKGGKKPTPLDYSELLHEAMGRSDFQLIQTVLLRSLRQAVYQPENEGHFGLAYEAYAHFTSPIRRFPDLLVHRAIKHVINQTAKGKTTKHFLYSKEEMLHYGSHCSVTERRADEATRDVVDWLKCEFMQDKLGEEFSGTVSGVTVFGLFISLHEVFVEGLIHVTSLKNDYYHFDPVSHSLQGERTGTRYRLGDELKVKVMRVSLEDRKIDFDLVEPASSKKPKATAESQPKKTNKKRRRK